MPDTDIIPAILKLKKEQADLRNERKRVAKELKNAERRRTRLRDKAKQLTDTDLVAVLSMRAAAKALAKASSGEPSASSNAAQPKAPPQSSSKTPEEIAETAEDGEVPPDQD